MLTGPTADHGPLRVEVVDQALDLDYRWEVGQAAQASPLSGPAWLSAATTVGDARFGQVRYLVARDHDGSAAVLPTHIVDPTAGPDADPRTYFGWRSGAGQACCGPAQPGAATAELDGLDPGRLFPTLLLGSLPGYQTEILHSFWTDRLAAALVEAALAYARDHGIPTVLAPWIADRGGGPALAAALRQHGAAEAFWAMEDHLPLPHAGWDEHVRALRYRDRYRINQDLRAASARGITVREMGPDELPQQLPRVGQLIAANRRRHGLPGHDDEAPATIAAITWRGAEVVATVGFLGEQLVACCLSLVKAGRLYAKYAGIDYQRIGTRSGVYFAVVVHATTRAAYRRAANGVEFGVGAHRAKVLRGCQSRAISSHLIHVHPDITEAFQRAAPAASQHRRAEYSPSASPPSTGGSCCA